MKKVISGLKSNIGAVITFLSVFVFSIYECIKKSGFHVDELYAFGLSNSHFAPFIDYVFNNDLVNKVCTKKILMDYLTVVPGQQFDYASVFYNQSIDTLPPFYYCCLHTLCSFFPGVFSKWLGLSLNYLFWIILLIYLYKTVELVTKSKYISCICVALYGLSYIGLSALLMIRAYMLLSMFTVVLIYYYIKNHQNEKNHNYFILCAVTYLGSLTHYNFVIFAFFLTAFYDFYLLCKKDFKKLFKYSAASLIGVVLMYATFPQVRDQFYSDSIVSGDTAFKYFMQFSRWLDRLGIFAEDTFCGIPGVFVLIALCAVVIAINAKKNGGKKKNEFPTVTIMFVASVVTFALCAIVAPAYTVRYVSNLVPGVTVFLGLLISMADFPELFKNQHAFRKSLTATALPIVIAAGVAFSIVCPPFHLYPEQKVNNQIIEQYAGSPCLVVTHRSTNTVTRNSVQLLNFDDFFVTDDPASSQAKDYLNSKSSDSFILYVEAYDKSVQLGFNVDDTVDCLLTEYPEYKTAKHLYSSGKTEIGTVEVYLISK